MYCIPKGNDNKEADMENKTVTENSTVSCAEEMNTAEVYGSDQYAADLKTAIGRRRGNSARQVNSVQ